MGFVNKLQSTYTVENNRKSNPLGPFIHTMPRQHGTAAVHGAQSNFQDQDWQGDEEEGNQVWDEEL